MPPGLTWREKLETVRNSGFDHLELSLDESDEKLARLTWDREQKNGFRAAMDYTDVPVRSICLSGHRKYPFGSHDANVRKRSLEIMEGALDFAACFGIRLIQLAGYDVYYEKGDAETRGFFVENLKKAVQMASERGVIMGFETMETPFMDTVGKAVHYVDLINSPNLGIYPDIGNLSNAALKDGHDYRADLDLGAGHIFAAHLKETKPGHYRNLQFGTGLTPYDEALQALYAQGVNLFVGEFWYLGSETWEEDIKAASVFLRTKIESIYGRE